jgi:hypothetical protein
MATDSQKSAGSRQVDPDDTSASMDSDPYLCSLLETFARPFSEERRRKPRGKTPIGRRALLLAEGRRKPS